MRDYEHSPHTPVATTSMKLSLAQAISVRRERLVWSRRAESWEHEGSAGLTKVVDAVLASCPAHTELALDLGCGSGQVTIPLARRCAQVLGVDVSSAAIELLEAKARNADIRNIQVLATPMESLDLEAESLSLVASNYAMHHLRDADKELLIERAMRWLRPGGALVIGDMMLGRGTAAGDREIIRSKVSSLAKRGPGGWWRIVKNAWKFALRVREKPLPGQAWESMLRDAGFVDVQLRRVVAEASVVSATKPL